MRSIRRITVIVILASFLIPGFLHASAPVGFWERAVVSSPGSVSTAVWKLLAFFWPNGAPGGLNKTGGTLDPTGTPAPGSGTTSGAEGSEGENGAALDPTGAP